MNRARDLRLFRPYADEAPWDLLAESGSDAETLADSVDLDLVRIAKLDDRIVGSYALALLSPTEYELVALAVERASRGRGFGRWLVGHALGLAESRGGRSVRVRGARHATFLARFGFARVDDGLLLELIPE